MQAFRRFQFNHALDFAIQEAKKLKKELVVYEGLRMDYPWSSERIHRFILEGMIDNFKEAKKLGITYWCYVETSENPAKGLLRKIAERASLIITDDFPCFIIPEQILALGKKVPCKMVSVDSNGVIPLQSYGSMATQARSVRIRLHKEFPTAIQTLARSYQSRSDIPIEIRPKQQSSPPFPVWEPTPLSISNLLAKISFPNAVPANPGIQGGRESGLKLLREFLDKKLARYGEDRSKPGPPEMVPSSLLSPYLHFGHISVQEIVQSVLDYGEKKGKSWSESSLNWENKGKREDFFVRNPAVNSYLDELLTWRDCGYQMFWQKPEFRKGLELLPDWAQKNRAKHDKDPRPFSYSPEQWERGETHDPIWNAAQKELVKTGRMHNYMRMLWGKKIIEWSGSYQEAYDRMEDFNNRFAYDGRNPNSYTGILWCFGMFDRPWFPERPVLGNIRYMSSDSTRKKFPLANYLDYVASLDREGQTLFG